MQSSKILLTGASGLLGQSIVKHFGDQHRITGISKSGRLLTRAVDLSSSMQINAAFEKIHPDLVIHTAAYTDVDGCERNPQAAYQSNVVAVKHLVQLCQDYRVPLIHISTDYVFSGESNRPYKETDEVFPLNVYGMTKLEGEIYVRRSSLDAVVIRTSWLFGPGSPVNFVNAILERFKTQKALQVLADQEDNPTYAADLSEAICRISGQLLVRAAAGHKKEQRLYHLTNQGSTTRYEMTMEIKKLLSSDVRVDRIDADRIENRLAVRPRYSALSNTKAQAELEIGMRPWQQALSAYVVGAIR